MPKLDVPQYNFSLPFYLVDISNFQLITSKIIPGDIRDSKNIVLTEQAIPGLGYNPVNMSGMGNRKVSFEIPVIKRNNTVGNILLVKQWELLRQKALSITQIFGAPSQFTPNPKVIFNWGIGSIPLVWYVTKCEMVHKGDWVNELANPTHTTISIELTLDEEDPVNAGETIFRQMSAYAGTILQSFDFLAPDGRSY